MADHLKSLELRLLRCSFPPLQQPKNPNPDPNPLIESLITSIERGNYFDALASPAANLVFKFADSFEFDNSVACAGRFYGEVERSVGAFLCKGDDDDTWMSFVGSSDDGGEEGDDGEREMDFESRVSIVLCLAVAALLAFVQQNVTGPVGVFSPFPMPFPQSKKADAIHGGGMWDMWAQDHLTSVGCGLLGKFMLLQYIVYAKILLSKANDLSMEKRNSCLNGSTSVSWWLCRLILLQQRILDEPSSSLYDQLQVCKKEILNQFSELKSVINYWGSLLCEGEAATIVSMAQLEAGILENKYCRVDSSRLHLERAEAACGMHHYVTGVLGFRTVHQVDAKAQYVLVPNTANQVNGDGLSRNSSLTTNDTTNCDEKVNIHTHECSDVLIKPKLLESVGGSNGNISSIGKDTRLTATQQAVLLAQCLHLQSRSRSDELSMWEMAPYIEAIDGQHQAYYSIRCFCDILRIRWESTRSHTKERALLMMEKLVEATTKDFPLAAQRIQIAFGVYLPTIPALRKEYGELLVHCGLIGEALKIFEDLELWDSLIFCYRLLDKKAAAVDLIKERLDDTPTDPRLWCSLGDVTNSDAYYEKALEVSSNKSARAKRSLARSAYNRGDYETSKILWELAMSINSLFPGGWFALGAAALKAQDFDKALDAFTHAVQLDPENGEAWNNIAFLHMRNNKSKPAFIAFKEALKFRRNTWQLWENYSHVALEIGNFYQALEATKQVLDLTNNKRVDVDLLDTIMRAVEESESNSTFGAEGHDIFTPKTDPYHSTMDSSKESSFSSKDHDIRMTETHSDESVIDSSEEFVNSEATSLKPQDSELLMNMLGNILAQLVRNGGGADIWGLYARWHKIKGNLTVCSEALLKQVRSYQGSDLWHDRDRFKKFAQVSLQLCKIYVEIASSTGSRRELTTAEMHLRNSVKQAVNFSDTEEFRELQACHEEIKKRLDATSNAGATHKNEKKRKKKSLLHGASSTHSLKTASKSSFPSYSGPVLRRRDPVLRLLANKKKKKMMMIFRRLMSRGTLTGRTSGWVGFSSASRSGRLEGKVALITGAASGIGKATAQEFIQEGATVIIADTDAALGSQAAHSLGPKARFVQCDVSDEPQVAYAVDLAFSLHGRLDVMYNNAGIVGPISHPDIADLDLAAFDEVMSVNARGALIGIKHAARVMGPVGSGSILCTCSMSGLMGGLGTHPYTISKFAVVGMVRSAAAELSRKGVRVNCISPFAVATRMTVEQFEMIFRGVGREKIVEIIGGLGELRGARCEEVDVARAAVYLASDEAKYVTGHNLVVDGGFTSMKRLDLRMPDGMA